jgi:hypothetical protein
MRIAATAFAGGFTCSDGRAVRAFPEAPAKANCDYDVDEVVTFGVGSVSHLSDTPSRRKRHPIGFAPPAAPPGRRKRRSS